MAFARPDLSQLGLPRDGHRDSAVKTFVIANIHGEKYEVSGNRYDLDGCYVSVIKDGATVASFATWSSIRVKEGV
jgi:hypothetical protein